MKKRLLDNLKGDRKYFTIVFFVLVLLLASGFITPLIVNRINNNWQGELDKKIQSVEDFSTKLYKEKENEVLQYSAEIKEKLRKALTSEEISYGDLITAVSEDDYKKISIEVIAPNGKLIAWNENIAIPQEEIFPLNFPPGEVSFYRSDLITYLTIIDTLTAESDLFYFLISIPVEKHYKIDNAFFEEISLSKEISDEFNTTVEINYDPFTPKTKDGRKYSFDLMNNKNKKTGLVTFIKPSVNTSIAEVYELNNKVQSILVFAGFLFLAAGMRGDFKKLKYRLYKFIFLFVYLALFRILIHWIEFPSLFFTGVLTEPLYFSSAFGWGIVKSPLEFLITNLFFLILVVKTFLYLTDYIRNNETSRFKDLTYFGLAFLPVAFLFFMTQRGLYASMKSVIFDSTLRYFKDPDIIPDIPIAVMNLNILLLGISILLLLLGYLLFLFNLIPLVHKKRLKSFYFYVFAGFQILGFLFIVLQKNPLITPLLGIIFITLIFILLYRYLFINQSSIYNYAYTALGASIITISLLNYFNLSLERDSLKTTAYEINRPNEGLLKFLMQETVVNGVKNKELIRAYNRRDFNFDAAAFSIWGGSFLQREALNSSISIYDNQLNKLGDFRAGVPEDKDYIDTSIYNGDGLRVFEKTLEYPYNAKLYITVLPVTDRGILLGYISASIFYYLDNLISGDIPIFLGSKKNILNAAVDISQLNIFKIVDGKLESVYGSIYPSREQIRPIINAELTAENETWLPLDFNGEKYIAYVLKSDENGTGNITTVAYKEKQLTWNLFNFFKIFILHTIYILGFLIIIYIIKLRNIKYTFKSQLLVAFLVISILPVAILAAYNRHIVMERSREANQVELSERVDYLVNHVNIQIEKHKDRSITTAFNNAAKETGILYSVFENTNQVFSSADEFYKAGLFTSKLNPEVHYNLNYLSNREYLTGEHIEKYVYNSLYRKVNINERAYIINVNDLFNKIPLTFSSIDIDVFLFGVYSFAVIIIIIISTVLANRISAPVRTLTSATQSVAHGDLNVKIENKERGEIKELIDGFNAMTGDLKKNELEIAAYERESAWKEMAKQVAHEIKNPLTPMKLAVQQLIISFRDRRDDFESIFEKLSSSLLNQINNLNQIASEFSRFARMPNFKLEEIELLSTLKDTANLFMHENIKIDIETGLDKANIEADKSQIQRAFINLIRNSIQAGASKILFSVQETGEEFSVCIQDNGKGIPEENTSRIFDENFTTKERGMGLGLKLTKRFFEGINSKISLVESDSSGTTFRIVIPKFK